MASRSLLDLNPETRKRAEMFVAKCATFGIGGHMAARLLFILERLIEQKLKKVAS